jgi:hypothetical protein
MRARSIQLAAGGRDEHAPAVALEETHAERALELGDLRAQRWLRDAASLGPPC